MSACRPLTLAHWGRPLPQSWEEPLRPGQGRIPPCQAPWPWTRPARWPGQPAWPLLSALFARGSQVMAVMAVALGSDGGGRAILPCPWQPASHGGSRPRRLHGTWGGPGPHWLGPGGEQGLAGHTRAMGGTIGRSRGHNMQTNIFFKFKYHHSHHPCYKHHQHKNHCPPCIKS